jgi:hypothetical protein
MGRGATDGASNWGTWGPVGKNRMLTNGLEGEAPLAAPIP